MTLEEFMPIVSAGIAAVEAAIDTIKGIVSNAQSGAVDPQTALDQIQALQQKFVADDAAATQALGAKFGG